MIIMTDYMNKKLNVHQRRFDLVQNLFSQKFVPIFLYEYLKSNCKLLHFFKLFYSLRFECEFFSVINVKFPDTKQTLNI